MSKISILIFYFPFTSNFLNFVLPFRSNCNPFIGHPTFQYYTIFLQMYHTFFLSVSQQPQYQTPTSPPSYLSMFYNHLHSWLGSHNPPSPSINKPWSGQEFFMSHLGLHPWLNEKNMILITCWKKIEHITFILGIQS